MPISLTPVYLVPEAGVQQIFYERMIQITKIYAEEKSIFLKHRRVPHSTETTQLACLLCCVIKSSWVYIFTPLPLSQIRASKT